MNHHPPSSPTTFALDTDIGTDVDDLLAVAMILGSPQLELSAITTVYGDVELRARLAAKAYSVAGRPAPSIAPGLAATRSGREVWWPGHEGSTIDDLDAQGYATERGAIDELTASSTIAAIAPLTNLAAAVERPGHRIRRVVMMGCDFGDDRIEHNIRCDVAAADVLLRSGVPLEIVGLEQTERIRLDPESLASIAEAGPLGRLLDAEVRRFWQFTGNAFNVPHDPLAVLVLAAPELFEFATGTVTVDPAGHTTFAPGAGGPHRIVADYDLDAARRQITDRILHACTTVPTAMLNEEETP